MTFTIAVRRCVLSAPWWMYLVAAVYLLALCLNAWQEAFGPASAGLLPAEPGLTIVRVTPGSALDRAGVEVGDVIESVGGLTVVSMSDWFVARAQFERNRRTEMQLRRRSQVVRVWFTITRPNWNSWNPATVAFQVARIVVLLVALLVMFRSPRQLSARLVGLIFGMISVAEGFPSAGWAAALAKLPIILAIPSAVATASWLLVPVAWLSLCALYPQPLFTRRWQWAVTLVPVAFFVPLLVFSAIAFVYSPASLRMPSPFVDSFIVQHIATIMGVFPQIFINLWPEYGRTSETVLLGLWFLISIMFLLTGFAALIVSRHRLAAGKLRRQMGWQIGLLSVVFLIGIHNIFVRNWTAFFVRPQPAVFSQASVVAEAVVFSFSVIALAASIRLCTVTEGQPKSFPAA
jgi:hypothetical protein